MSDPTVMPPPMTLISTSSRADDATATADDDLAIARLATWLADVSAEATLRPAGSDVEPPLPETVA